MRLTPAPAAVTTKVTLPPEAHGVVTNFGADRTSHVLQAKVGSCCRSTSRATKACTTLRALALVWSPSVPACAALAAFMAAGPPCAALAASRAPAAPCPALHTLERRFAP